MNNSKTLIIIGAGGHGKVAADCAKSLGEFQHIHFLDGEYPDLNKVAEWDVVGKAESFLDFDGQNTWYFVAIGNNQTREIWQKKLMASAAKITTLIHPSACISPSVNIGQGALVLAGAVINIMTDIGEGSIINTGATVDHDCEVGAFCHLAPGVNLAGGVTLKEHVFMGIGSCAIQCLSIGQKSVIGAGSVVLKNIPAQVTAVGSPAKIIRGI